MFHVDVIECGVVSYQPSCGEASSQKLAAGQRTRLQWNNGSVRGAASGWM